MDIKPWEYADFPAFNEPVPGATRVPTTDDEIGVTYHPDVPYATAGTTTLHLQILVPQTRNQTDATTYPCMVHVQGSAWMKQDRTALVPTLSRIAERGFVVAIVEYRHSGIASFPAQIQDARNAVRFMRANAAQYHVDADNLFLSGCSSGGQVALLAAVAHAADRTDMDDTSLSLAPNAADVSDATRGVIDYFGAVNGQMDDGFPSTVDHHLATSPEGMMMGHVDLRDRPDLRAAMTVESYLTPELALPPVLILHGTKDRLVNARQSASLYRRLRDVGKSAELYLLEGADHGGAEFWTDGMCRVATDFMRSNCAR